MVLHHIAQRARLVIIPAAPFHADAFGHGDLHMVYVLAVPERFKQSIGKADRHQVLHGFFAEVMVYPVNLVLIEARPKLRV